MAPNFHFGLLMLFFTVFTVFLAQIPHSSANTNDDCPKNELQISNNSILDPPGMNGKLRKQFQLVGPENCADEFTIVFPLEIDVNSDVLENGAFLEDYKQFWNIKCHDTESTTETEQSTTPILTSSTPTTLPKRTVDYIYSVAGQVLANDTKFVGFSLCAPNEKVEDCWLRMNIMANGEVKVLTKINGQKEFDVYEWENITIIGNSSLNLIVLFRQYYIEFRLEYNGTHFNFHHLPAFWYKTVNAFQDMHYETVGDWQIVEFIGYKETDLPTPHEMFPVHIPWAHAFIQELTVQSHILIRGHVKSAANNFHIAFLHHARETHENIGKTVANLIVNVHERAISLGEKINPKNKLPSYLKPDTYFEAKLVAYNKTTFEMQLLSSNGDQQFTFALDLPLWSITHMNIHGDVELFEHPKIFFQKAFDDGYGLTLSPPLDVGDSISINFRTAAEPADSEFSIWLLSGTKEYNDEIGHTPMRITFKYHHSGMGNAVLSSTKIDNCCKLENVVEKEEIIIFSNAFAVVSITVNEESFEVTCAREVGNYEYKKSGFPSWSVDHIKVTDGQFLVAPKIDIIRKSKVNNLELPYMLMLNNSLVADGDIIEIKGKKNWKFDHFTVHLFHGAKNFDKTVGQTVLQIEIFKEKMQFSAYIGTDWNGGRKMKISDLRSIPLLDQLTLRIYVQEGEYKFVLTLQTGIDEQEVGNFVFKHNLPNWAVLQMVRIEGDLELLEEPKKK